MSHLSEDLTYELAIKVTDEAELSSREEEALMHVTECDDCYQALRAMMAMLQVSRNIGALAVGKKAAEAAQPVRETIRAIVNLAIDKAGAVLDQISGGAGGWRFRSAPMLLAGARGAGGRTCVRRLTDQQNTKNFVAYDPAKKLLMIQLDASGYSEPPMAFLTLSDGTETEIPFEQRGDIFWAEVAELDEGSYEISLEK